MWWADTPAISQPSPPPSTTLSPSPHVRHGLLPQALPAPLTCLLIAKTQITECETAYKYLVLSSAVRSQAKARCQAKIVLQKIIIMWFKFTSVGKYCYSCIGSQFVIFDAVKTDSKAPGSRRWLFWPCLQLHIIMETKRCYFLGVHLWVFGPHVCLQSKASQQTGAFTLKNLWNSLKSFGDVGPTAITTHSPHLRAPSELL